MKVFNQSGLTTLQIILALTAVAIAFALISTFFGTSDEDQQMAAQTAETAKQTDTPIETFAKNKAETLTEPVEQAVQAKNEEIEAEMDVKVEPDPEVVETPVAPVTAAAAGTFEDYGADKLALADNGTVVLFFHADWCPTCRGLENDLNANLGSIPPNTHILKLDYDTETELKKKYKVIRQHTLVVVDANGNEIKKLTGLTNTLDQVVNQL